MSSSIIIIIVILLILVGISIGGYFWVQARPLNLNGEWISATEGVGVVQQQLIIKDPNEKAISLEFVDNNTLKTMIFQVTRRTSKTIAANSAVISNEGTTTANYKLNSEDGKKFTLSLKPTDSIFEMKFPFVRENCGITCTGRYLGKKTEIKFV